ncbi:aldo/keto reductase [Kribbella sp. NPDC004138]
MEQRKVGESDLVTSEIALGSWLTYGDRVDRETAADCVRRAYELGISLFDCANVYGRGAAESLLGEVLGDFPRDSYLLATKVYFPMGRGELGLSAAQVRKQCDESLRRFGVDHIDLYQCHRYDTRTPLEETMTALTELVAAGKIRYAGFSEWTAEQITAAVELPGVTRFASSQPEYSILHRAPEEAVFGACEQFGIGNIVYSPLAQGVLTGKYRAGEAPPEGSRAASRATRGSMGSYAGAENIAKADQLREVAAAAGLSMTQLALAWALRDPVVSATIVGASRPEQLEDSVSASGVTLDAATLAAIDAVTGTPS